ncbi:GGDEF domain-containing protein [Marinifilum sp. JC120]|nr:GGDEF domain-containing protein [Marinifilum sp. JC120]
MDKLNFMGGFKDPTLEESFQKEKWPSVRFRLLFLYFVTVVTYFAGGYSDYIDLGLGSEFHTILLGRIGACLLGSAAFCLLLVDKNRLRMQYAFMSLCMFSVLGAESLELVIKSSDIGSLSVPTAVFIVLAYYVLLSPRILPPFIAAVSGSILYLFTLSTIVPVHSGTFMNSLSYFFLANMFGIFFLYTFGRSLRREYAAMEDLKKLVEFDELTGVCSRRKVLEAGNCLFRSARRFESKLAVLMVDIDHFKKVNDDYGHCVGDEVLKEAARRCGNALREVDHFGRLGGEEFLIILPHSSLHDGINIAERLRVRVREKMFNVDEAYLPISVSIGVAELKDHDDFKSLIQDADEQLYRAKKCGRNQVCPAMFGVVKQIQPTEAYVE